MMRASGGTPLLEVLPDLAEGLPVAEAEAAAQALVIAHVRVDPGDVSFVELAQRAEVRGHLRALVVIQGLLGDAVSLQDRACLRLHGPGDILGVPDGEPSTVPVVSTLSAEGRAVLGLLDDRVLAVAGRWPRIAGRLFSLTVEHGRRTFVQQAISQLPRVEDRLLATLWALAERWGHVHQDGVVLDLPLTHTALGRLVGARRPTVSLAMTALANGDLVHPDPGGSGWRLTHESVDALNRSTGLRTDPRQTLLRRRSPEAAEPQPSDLHASSDERRRRSEAAIAASRELLDRRRESRLFGDREPARVLIIGLDLAVDLPGTDDVVIVDGTTRALEELAGAPPDVVVADFEALSSTHTDLLGAVGGARLILVLPSEGGTAAAVSIMAAADDLLVKPVSSWRLATCIDAQLALSAARAGASAQPAASGG